MTITRLKYRGWEDLHEDDWRRYPEFDESIQYALKIAKSRGLDPHDGTLRVAEIAVDRFEALMWAKVREEIAAEAALAPPPPRSGTAMKTTLGDMIKAKAGKRK